MRKFKLIGRYKFSIAWLLIMAYLLFSPSNTLPRTGFLHVAHFDKVVHFGMFGMMTLLFFFETERQGSYRKSTFWFFLATGISFAIISELVQAFLVEGRHGSFADLISDSAGMLAGLGFYFIVLKKYALFVLLNRLKN